MTIHTLNIIHLIKCYTFKYILYIRITIIHLNNKYTCIKMLYMMSNIRDYMEYLGLYGIFGIIYYRGGVHP